MMKKVLIPLISSLTISGCSHMPSFLWQEDVAEIPTAETEKQIDAAEAEYEQYSPSVAASVKFRDEYRELLLIKQHTQAAIDQKNSEVEKRHESEKLDQNINYYVRGLMQDLIANLQYVNSTTPLAVTSFALLDGDYNQTNLLGKQIAESFIHEVHKFGIPVIDFKTTDYIRVTPNGDFILSQDYLELKDGLPIRYVIAGTLVKHQGGFLVNARILGVESKAVVASAQNFIPANVSKALVASTITVKEETKPAVSLVQGM